MLKSRWKFWVLGVVMVFGFSAVLIRLARLQITSEVDYAGTAQVSMTKTIYETGSRGQILDVNGALLAYDKKIYNIMFYHEPSSKREKKGEYSKAIWEIIRLMRTKGKEVRFSFWLSLGEDGQWVFDPGTTDEGVYNAREKMFRSNFYIKNVEIQDMYKSLCYSYMIDEIDTEFDESEKLTLDDKLAVLSVWQEMQMNAFSSLPIQLVADVDWTTVMEVETRLSQLPGMSVSVKNQRVYPKGTLACHILGYTGLMQTDQQIEDYVVGKKYQRNDTIGLDGVEQTMEQFLTANSFDRRGYTLAEVDRMGKQIRQLAKVEPKDGNTIKLTIDSALQKVVEEELAKVVNAIRDVQEKVVTTDTAWQDKNKDELLKYQSDERELKLAQNGAIVVLDMNARVLAMASYPNYDPNLFITGMNEEQRLRVFKDPRNPLLNNAIKSADEPGSVFKMATALAALSYGKVDLVEEISDRGKFTLYDEVMPPKCWINPGSIDLHQNLTVRTGIAKSCNYFFFTLASRLGTDGDGTLLYEYTTRLGLTSKTNIDLPGEKKSIVGSQLTLYDPSRPISGYDQDTWIPVQVRDKIKKHLKQVGESVGLTYSDERLNICAKSLMDMAVNTNQGPKQVEWMSRIRQILMDELSMPRDLVFKASTMTDLVIVLNDIKWGGSQTIMAAVGQSVTMITPVAMARYIVAIANGGRVYDVQLIDSIVSPTGETIKSFDQPVLVNDLSDEIGKFLPEIWLGMQGVVDEGGTAQSAFKSFKYGKDIVAGKTGTAQKSKIDVENNSWFVSFAPIEAPEIVVVVYVPNGYAGARSAPAAANIIEYYLDSKVVDHSIVLPVPNSLAQ